MVLLFRSIQVTSSVTIAFIASIWQNFVNSAVIQFLLSVYCKSFVQSFIALSFNLICDKSCSSYTTRLHSKRSRKPKAYREISPFILFKARLLLYRQTRSQQKSRQGLNINKYTHTQQETCSSLHHLHEQMV